MSTHKVQASALPRTTFWPLGKLGGEREGRNLFWTASSDNPEDRFQGILPQGLLYHPGDMMWGVLLPILPKMLSYILLFSLPLP